MKRFIGIILACIAAAVVLSTCASSAQGIDGGPLRFNPSKFVRRSFYYNGMKVQYRLYEGVVYVANPVKAEIPKGGVTALPMLSPEEAAAMGLPPLPAGAEGLPPFPGMLQANKVYPPEAYHTMNIYVPYSAVKSQTVPIIFKNGIMAYMPNVPEEINADGITGWALRNGYIVVCPGARGRETKSLDGKNVGKAPAGIVDLKAAVRYLKYNDDVMPGDANKIISDGMSAGGAMSALLGASGNNPLYEPYLKELGAAPATDDIFGVFSFCPVMDLEHSDMSYEFLLKNQNEAKKYNVAQIAVSEELAALYPAYLSSLELTFGDGSALTADNYTEYLTQLLIESAQKALDTGFVTTADLEAKSWLTLDDTKVSAIDYDAFMASVGRMKAPPAFDTLGVLGGKASPENSEFGNETTDALNFTDWGVSKAKSADMLVDQSVKDRVYLLNPMNFIGAENTKTAPYWYIRHGSLDRDTSFTVPVNLYRMLAKNKINANFAIAWDRGHMGDYDLDEMIKWINDIMR